MEAPTIQLQKSLSGLTALGIVGILVLAGCSDSDGPESTNPSDSPLDMDGDDTTNDPLEPQSEEEGVEIDIVLDENFSGYAELLEDIDERDANDGKGHLNQRTITQWVVAGTIEDQLEFLFDHGDELTEIEFTAVDGIGALDTPARFSRHPTNGRFTGPNARSCGACHDQSLGNGGGRNVANVIQDPEPDVVGDFNIRNTRNINGDAWLQLASTEMTLDMQAQRAALKAQALSAADSVTGALESKGVSFGQLICEPDGDDTVCDYSGVEGVSPDLVVRTQGWKGNLPTIRAFSEDAFFGEMGIHSDRFAYFVAGTPLPNDAEGSPPDVDLDGVSNEMSIGDISAMEIYLAAQAPPTTYLVLQEEGKLELTPQQVARIELGATKFAEVGCTDCHKASLPVKDPLFKVPDIRVEAYFDSELAGTNNGYDPVTPVVIDLSTTEIVERFLPQTMVDGERMFEVKAMTDLKRHFMGAHLCDDSKRSSPALANFQAAPVPSDSEDQDLDMRIGVCEWLTPDLWGIGGTSPYMHDGEASILREAINLHCSQGEEEGEGNSSCRAFRDLGVADQRALVAFLLNQVMEPEPEDEEEEVE